MEILSVLMDILAGNFLPLLAHPNNTACQLVNRDQHRQKHTMKKLITAVLAALAAIAATVGVAAPANALHPRDVLSPAACRPRLADLEPGRTRRPGAPVLGPAQHKPDRTRGLAGHPPGERLRRRRGRDVLVTARPQRR